MDAKTLGFGTKLCLKVFVFLSNVANYGDFPSLCRPGVAGTVGNDFMLAVVGLHWAEEENLGRIN